jgi:hypothetical protein
MMWLRELAGMKSAEGRLRELQALCLFDLIAINDLFSSALKPVCMWMKRVRGYWRM